MAKMFIDLFAGCGGLSLGLLNSGWKGLFAIEKSPDAFKTLQHNLIDRGKHNLGMPKIDWPKWLDKGPHELRNFIAMYDDELSKLRGSVQLVAGGPPCQGFSFAGKRSGDDPRNQLFKLHLDVVDITEPEIVLLENVLGIDVAFAETLSATTGRVCRRKSYASQMRYLLEKHGYHVQQDVVLAADFGVPQLRSRYFTIGIRGDLFSAGELPDFFDILHARRTEFLRARRLPIQRHVTVAEAISDLDTTNKTLVDCKDPESPRGFKEIVYKTPNTPYQKLMHGDLNGCTPNSLRLVNHLPQTVLRFEEILRCCRKGIQISKENRLRLGMKKHAVTPLAPDMPSHTVTTLPDDLLHYAEPRIHTVREHARLQSFPDWFEFRGKYTTGNYLRATECPRYTQVGNAVPPLLAEVMGDALDNLLRKAGRQNPVHGNS